MWNIPKYIPNGEPVPSQLATVCQEEPSHTSTSKFSVVQEDKYCSHSKMSEDALEASIVSDSAISSILSQHISTCNYSIMVIVKSIQISPCICASIPVITRHSKNLNFL